MSEQNIDMVQVFQQVTKVLNQNQQALNKADEYNQDHGDHMVETFQTITSALQEKQGENPADMLSYAANLLGQKTQSGSGKLYAEGLQQAAKQVQGQNINPQTAVQLLQTLIGGGQTQPQTSQQNQGGDLLGSLLGGLMGGQTTAQPQQPQQTQQGGGLLGSLLGGITGGQGDQGGLNDGLDMGDLIQAGMAFMKSKQQGESNLEAIIDAVTAASGMGSQPYRQQSTQLVANTFLQAISQMGKK